MFVYRRNRLDRSEPESAVICFAAAATFRRFGSVSADAKFVKVGSNEKILRETEMNPLVRKKYCQHRFEGSFDTFKCFLSI